MPHKDIAARNADSRTPIVQRLGAANTLTVTDDGIEADNTDVGGFSDFLQMDAGFSAQGRTALVYGGGGAARACAAALLESGVGRLVVAVRRPEDTAEAFASVFGDDAVQIVPFLQASAVDADLVVNATPLGRAGEELPLPALGPGILAVDLLYHAETPLLAAARSAGAEAHGGLGLLVRQAARSFQVLWGSPAPAEAMWRAARQAVAGQDAPS